eukprot:6203685-Pleurochrysis_carterae.AAC.5
MSSSFTFGGARTGQSHASVRRPQVGGWASGHEDGQRMSLSTGVSSAWANSTTASSFGTHGCPSGVGRGQAAPRRSTIDLALPLLPDGGRATRPVPAGAENVAAGRPLLTRPHRTSFDDGSCLLMSTSAVHVNRSAGDSGYGGGARDSWDGKEGRGSEHSQSGFSGGSNERDAVSIAGARGKSGVPPVPHASSSVSIPASPRGTGGPAATSQWSWPSESACRPPRDAAIASQGPRASATLERSSDARPSSTGLLAPQVPAPPQAGLVTQKNASGGTTVRTPQPSVQKDYQKFLSIWGGRQQNQGEDVARVSNTASGSVGASGQKQGQHVHQQTPVYGQKPTSQSCSKSQLSAPAAAACAPVAAPAAATLQTKSEQKQDDKAQRQRKKKISFHKDDFVVEYDIGTCPATHASSGNAPNKMTTRDRIKREVVTFLRMTQMIFPVSFALREPCLLWDIVFHLSTSHCRNQRAAIDRMSKSNAVFSELLSVNRAVLKCCVSQFASS